MSILVENPIYEEEFEDEYDPEFELDESPFHAESFPSGVTLTVGSGATGPRQEHWDPHGTGLPLYQTGTDVRAKKLSANFTVGELATSGGRAADRARISPQLVTCLQAIRDRAGRPVRITSGYRSWARNVAIYKARGKQPTLSRHCSGQAADITIAGLSGIAIAKLAIDVCGANVALGVGERFAHIDVRGAPTTWTYFTGPRDAAARKEIDDYRSGSRAPIPPSPHGAIRAGSKIIDRVPLLARHVGTRPDLWLGWNTMVAPSVVDVVVHLHGFASQAHDMDIVRHKLPISGLDFADPDKPGTVGRTSPTLLVLPRGSHQPNAARYDRYTFPDLVKPGALQSLIELSLAEFARATGASVTRNRLILTAHSGGGAALVAILAHTDPDEVYTFDALYNDPKNLISWAQRRMAAGTGALRVLYRAGEQTARNSERVARAVSIAGSPSFRVERTTVGHNSIPRRFGWRLLADSAADLPSTTKEGEDVEEAEIMFAAERLGDDECRCGREVWDDPRASWSEHSEAVDPILQSKTTTVMISDYPRYGTRVANLRPDLVDSLKAVSKGIIRELLANRRVMVVVEGFADFDAKGRDFEQQVSLDRSASARSFIVGEVHRLARVAALPPRVLQHFSAGSVGFGSRRPSIRNPRNEEQRRQNRRVHVLLESSPLPQPTGPSFQQAIDRAEKSLGRITRPGPKRRLTCMLAKLRDSRNADGYFSYDALKQFPGHAGWPKMSPSQFDLLVKTTIRHARPEVQSISAAARDEFELATQLEALDDNIGRNIFNFETQLVGDSATGILVRTFNATIGRLQQDPLSILACYSKYARIRHDQ